MMGIRVGMCQWAEDPYHIGLYTLVIKILITKWILADILPNG